MRQAMLFAAGLGTRLRPLTDNMPKALVRVGEKPLLQLMLEKLHRSGFEHVVVNVHHFPDQIIDFINNHVYEGMTVSVSDEREALLETGGGLRKAAPLFDGSSHVLIHNVDILSNADLVDCYDKALEHDALLVVSQRETSRYLLFDDDMRLVGWTNVKTGEVKTPYDNLDVARCKRLAFSGIHVMSPELMDRMKTWQDRFGIIDFYLDQCDKADIRALALPDLHLLDVGKIDSLAEAQHFLKDLSRLS